MQILNNSQILQKIDRIACEIYERNFPEKEIFLLGINNNGYRLAELIKERILAIDDIVMQVNLMRVKVHAANPLQHNSYVEGGDVNDLTGKHVIVVDDVANTGRTLFYAFDPLLSIIPDKVEVAVMVDRKHKLFPVQVDYVGLSLATTLMENISVQLSESNMQALLN